MYISDTLLHVLVAIQFSVASVVSLPEVLSFRSALRERRARRLLRPGRNVKNYTAPHHPPVRRDHSRP